jgi:hypothetical protein
MVVVSNQVEMRQILTDMLVMLGYEAESLSPIDGEFTNIMDSPCLGIVNADRPEDRIRECLAGLPGLPLVLLGGYGSTDLVRAFADRIVAVIPPPVSLDGFRSTLENLVGGGSFN